MSFNQNIVSISMVIFFNSDVHKNKDAKWKYEFRFSTIKTYIPTEKALIFSAWGIKEFLHSCFIFYNCYGTANDVIEKFQLNYNVIEFIGIVPIRIACKTGNILEIKYLRLLKIYELLI